MSRTFTVSNTTLVLSAAVASALLTLIFVSGVYVGTTWSAAA